MQKPEDGSTVRVATSANTAEYSAKKELC